ncbi:adenylate/guanylate cyclase domain-containing protein [Desertibaculum subflavum]|uniref:adenylate/guanylate cyclase domain-containing protein n=1 Tax=Desertibaculum subflavum TaxID=2268458 RepID=UPI000E664CB0
MPPSLPRTEYTWTGDTAIACQQRGQHGPHLLFVPGLISHLEVANEWPTWAQFLDRLGSFTRLVTFDKRGQGLSDRIGIHPSPEERLDDIHAVVRMAGADHPYVLGFSEGGALAMLYAASFPDRVRGLILYGSMARFCAAPDYPYMWSHDAMLRSVKYWGTGGSLKSFAPSLEREPNGFTYWARLEREALSPGDYQRSLKANANIDVRAILPSIRVPTLVIHRATDAAVPVDNGRYLARHIPGAEYLELPSGEHLPIDGDAEPIIKAVARFVAADATALEPDRVLATVMFTDIVDSTARATRLGDRDWLALRARHDQVVARCMERYRGRRVHNTGDGILAVFDGPGRAISCARDLHRELSALDLAIRVALHTGEIELRGDEVGGIAVHIAARILALAGAGETMVSRVVTDLVVGALFDFVDRGQHALKGVDGSWQIYSLAGGG